MAEVKTEPQPFERAITEISDWIMQQTLGVIDIDEMTKSFCERMVGVGIPLWRLNLGVPTLHPMFESMTIIWERGRGLHVDQHTHGALDTPEFRSSPFFYALSTRTKEMRRKLVGPDAKLDFAILPELQEQGGTDYLLFITTFGDVAPAVHGGGGDGMLTSWTSDDPDGFSDAHIAAIKRLQSRFAVAVKTVQREQTAFNVMSAYLGSETGRRVLEGRIRLGDFEAIPAVIWYSDLRHSTELADRLSTEVFVKILNAYFAATAGAVLDHGGEVLRFIGDAVLAIFPVVGPGGAARAARMAYAAARDSVARIETENEVRKANGDHEIGLGLALHEGKVLFGNIGVPDRLEFSVIGPAVNEVCRLEGLTKNVNEPIVASAEFVRHLAEPWRSLGYHGLRGIGDAMEVFAP